MHERSRQREAGHDQAIRLQQIGGKQQRNHGGCDFFQQRMACRIAARHTVVGKHRDHPAAHHHHDEQHHIEPQLQTHTRREFKTPLQGEVHRQHQGADQQQQCDKKIIARVARPYQRNTDRQRDGQRKRRIHHGGGHRP